MKTKKPDPKKLEGALDLGKERAVTRDEILSKLPQRALISGHVDFDVREAGELIRGTPVRILRDDLPWGGRFGQLWGVSRSGAVSINYLHPDGVEDWAAPFDVADLELLPGDDETWAKLRGIRVIWRQPDTMSLWGIPHAMRAGQTPGNLWGGRLVPDTIRRAQGWHGATLRSPGPREGWVWLGAPCWWGNLPESAQRAIEAYRKLLDVPSNPGEWSEVPR